MNEPKKNPNELATVTAVTRSSRTVASKTNSNTELWEGKNTLPAHQTNTPQLGLRSGAECSENLIIMTNGASQTNAPAASRGAVCPRGSRVPTVHTYIISLHQFYPNSKQGRRPRRRESNTTNRPTKIRSPKGKSRLACVCGFVMPHAMTMMMGRRKERNKRPLQNGKFLRCCDGSKSLDVGKGKCNNCRSWL